MLIKTTRFGQVECQESDLIHFEEGILGFADLTRFVILDDPNDEIFAWLQSCEAPAIAFPVLESELLSQGPAITLAKTDLEILGLTSAERARFFSIITIPDDPTLMTANLKAPVVINVDTRSARQCVMQDNTLAIREPIFAKLQQRVVNSPDKSIKAQSVGLDVAVKIESKNQPSEAEL